MYNVKTLQTNFTSLIGLRQSNIPGVPTVQSPLSVSNTGIYVDDKHPLVSTENLYYSSPLFEASSYPQWAPGSYIIGQKVNYSGVLYIALLNNNVPPGTDATKWGLYYPFQSWLQQKYNQAVSNLFSEIVKRKKLQKMGKAIIERQQLYRGVGSLYDKIIPQGRGVGFAICPQQAEGLWVILDKIGIQLTQTQNLPVYLYHSSKQDAPICSWTYSATGGNFNWQDLTLNGDKNAILKYLTYDTSGFYIFMFYEDDITSGNTVISKKWNCASLPCGSCDGIDLSMYNIWSRYTTFRNISFPASAIDYSGKTLPDLNKAVYDNITNWGMNFSLTVRCDLTDFISDNLFLWSDAFSVQLCKEYLEAIANGCRIGPNPAQTKLSAISALDEKAPGNWISKSGGYYDTIDALNIDFSGFSSSCMPCEQNKKVKFFSM